MSRPAERVSMLVGVLALSLLGCHNGNDEPSRSPASIYNVQLQSDPAEISVSLQSCSSTAAQIEVDETRAEVRLTARTSNDVDGDCGDGALVTLTRPLGDRVVVDALTGKQVTVLNGYGLERGRLYEVAVQPVGLTETDTPLKLAAELGVSPLGCATLDGDLLVAPLRSVVSKDNRLQIPGFGTWRVGEEVAAFVVRTEIRPQTQLTRSVRRCLVEGRTSEIATVVLVSLFGP